MFISFEIFLSHGIPKFFLFTYCITYLNLHKEQFGMKSEKVQTLRIKIKLFK